MRLKMPNSNYKGRARRRVDNPLNLAVRLVLNQLSQGIGFAEAVQFAAKYHGVTCAAIEAVLSREGTGVFDKVPGSR